MNFGCKVLHFFISVVAVAGLVRPAFADETEKCRPSFWVQDEVVDADYEVVSESAPQEFDEDDLYNLLLRERPLNLNVRVLFAKAAIDPVLRRELLELISKNTKLKHAADRGLAFKPRIQAFLENTLLGRPASLFDALYPRRVFQTEYFAFKNSQKNWVDKPISQAEAEKRARAETISRYGLREDFDGSDLAANPTAQDYYRRRAYHHSSTEEPKRVQKEKLDEQQIRIWLGKKRQQLDEDRLKNYVTILKKIAAIEGKKFSLTFDFAYFFAVVSKNLSILDALEAPHRLVRGTEVPGFKVGITGTNRYPGVPGRERTNALLLNTTSDKHVEPTAAAFYAKGAPPESLSFTLPESGFTRAATSHERSMGRPAPMEYVLPLADLYQQVSQYVKALGVGTNTESTLIAKELMLQINLDLEWAVLQDFIDSQLKQTRLQKFEIDLFNFVKIGNETASNDLYVQLRRLLTPQLDDALTGIEWYGYQINGRFWLDRDHRANKILNGKKSKVSRPWIVADNAKDIDIKLTDYSVKESTASSLKRAVKDRFSKARNWVQAAVILTAVVGGVPSLIHGISKIAGSSTSSSSISPNSVKSSDAKITRINPDNESHDMEPNLGDSASIFFTSWSEMHGPGGDNGFVPPPRNFTHASILEVEDEAQLVDVTNQVELADEERVRHNDRQTVHVNSEAEVRDFRGYVTVPRPEGNYAMSRINFYDYEGSAGYGYNLDVIEKILIHPQTGNYLIKLKEGHERGRYSFGVTFFRPASAPDHIDFDDPRFHHLDRARLVEIGHELVNSGIGVIGKNFVDYVERSEDLSVSDLGDFISSEHLYSLRPGKYAKWYAGLLHSGDFSQFSRYERDDTLYMKCDQANSLYRDVLRAYFKDEKDIHVDLLSSWIYKNTKSRGGGFNQPIYVEGIMSSIGHARTAIRIDGRAGQFVWDATSGKQEDGTVMPPTKHSEKDADQRDRELAKLPKAPAKEKSGRAPLSWIGPRRRSDAFETEEHFGDETTLNDDSIELEKRRHQQMRQQLQQRLEKVLYVEIQGKRYDNSSFKNLVRRTQILPPQRMYILAKTLSYFADREMTLDQLMQKLHELYPAIELVKPTQATEMVDNLKKVLKYETDLWAKLARLYNKRGRAPYYWTELPDLKQVIFGLMDTVTSYHWQDPVTLRSPEE